MQFAAVVAAAMLFQTVSAQDTPGKTVRMVAGMAAGGGADANARRLALIVNRILRQNVVVENIAGAAGNLAAQTVADAAPDGNTWVGSPGTELEFAL